MTTEQLLTVALAARDWETVIGAIKWHAEAGRREMSEPIAVALSEREWEAVLEAIDDSLAGCLQPGVCKRCERLKRAVAQIHFDTLQRLRSSGSE